MTDPSSKIRELFTEFASKKWNSDPSGRVADIVSNHPNAVAELVLTGMRELPEGATFLDASLSFLREDEWPVVVKAALDTYEDNPENDAAEGILSNGIMQALPSIHPHLERLFFMDSFFTTYYSTWAWRESGSIAFRMLREELEQENSSPDPTANYREQYTDTRMRAWHAFLETRDSQCLNFAIHQAESLGITKDRLSDYLLDIGSELTKNGLRQLYPDNPLHISFPADYLEQIHDRPYHRMTRRYPSWLSPGVDERNFRFGGLSKAGCHKCGRQTNHLITLDPIPVGMGISSVSRLELVTCMSCYGCHFFKHDQFGTPTHLRSNRSDVLPSEEAIPIAEVRVGLMDCGARWKWQDWAIANDRDNLNRLGGFPSWVQSPEHPSCPGCHQLMPFLMQLGSCLPDANGGELLWGSGGVCYGFWCDECRISGSTWQCT